MVDFKPFNGNKRNNQQSYMQNFEEFTRGLAVIETKNIEFKPFYLDSENNITINMHSIP